MKTKDCPFCGARALFEGHRVMQTTEGEETKLYVECERCGARGPILPIKASTPAELKIMRASIAWNCRNGRADVNARRQLAAMALIREEDQTGRSSMARMRRLMKEKRNNNGKEES